MEERGQGRGGQQRTSAALLPAHKTHAPATGAEIAPSRPWTRSQFPRPAKSRELRSPGALTPSARRGKPPRQLTALGGLPGRLTRRLFTSFHSATLRSAPRPRAPPPRRCSQPSTINPQLPQRHCPQARCAMPPYDSAALHFVKTGETGGSPGQRITSPSSGNALSSPPTARRSLAYAAARSCAGPQC